MVRSTGDELMTDIEDTKKVESEDSREGKRKGGRDL